MEAGGIWLYFSLFLGKNFDRRQFNNFNNLNTIDVIDPQATSSENKKKCPQNNQKSIPAVLGLPTDAHGQEDLAPRENNREAPGWTSDRALDRHEWKLIPDKVSSEEAGNPCERAQGLKGKRKQEKSNPIDGRTHLGGCISSRESNGGFYDAWAPHRLPILEIPWRQWPKLFWSIMIFPHKYATSYQH